MYLRVSLLLNRGKRADESHQASREAALKMLERAFPRVQLPPISTNTTARGNRAKRPLALFYTYLLNETINSIAAFDRSFDRN